VNLSPVPLLKTPVWLVQSRGAVRIYQSGQPVTQDFSESRLNLETDAAGNLVIATCGQRATCLRLGRLSERQKP
jgi:hypothetical protein